MQHDPEDVGRCSEADMTTEFHYSAGTMVSAVEFCNSNECACMDNVNGSSAWDQEISMVGLTACESFITLVAVLCRLAHNGLQFLATCTGIELVIVAKTATALMCGWWYFHLKMSHLSCGDGDVRSRTCRKIQRRLAIRQQRQPMALLFLCGFANARAMDEQEAAFLQRMTSMAEAATRAAAAAERALERTTGGASGAHEGLSAASRILKSPDVFFR